MTESLQGSIRLNRSQLIDQELTIRPEANIDANVPENLDLYKVIYEVESDNEPEMSEVDGVAVHDNNSKEPVSDWLSNSELCGGRIANGSVACVTAGECSVLIGQLSDTALK